MRSDISKVLSTSIFWLGRTTNMRKAIPVPYKPYDSRILIPVQLLNYRTTEMTAYNSECVSKIMSQTTSNGQNKIKNTFVEACGHCQIKPKSVNCCENFDILSVPGCFQILQAINDVTKISFYTAITNNDI